MQTELAAHLVFRADISARGRVVTNENNSEARRKTAGLQFRDFAAEIDINFFSDGAAIDQIWHRAESTVIWNAKGNLRDPSTSLGMTESNGAAIDQVSHAST
jgi:hypothetical protein